MKHFSKTCDSENGFTLVELMITLLILAILVGIVGMTMTITQRRARQAACKMNLKVIYDAINQYAFAHDGEYPANLDILINENYLNKNFNWQCPSGDNGALSGDYRDNYSSVTGQASCPRPEHNP